MYCVLCEVQELVVVVDNKGSAQNWDSLKRLQVPHDLIHCYMVCGHAEIELTFSSSNLNQRNEV